MDNNSFNLQQSKGTQNHDHTNKTTINLSNLSCNFQKSNKLQSRPPLSMNIDTK